MTGSVQLFDGSNHTGLWVTGNNPTTLTEIAGSTGSSPNGISIDGSVIVGTFFDASGNNLAYRWTSATGAMTQVPLISGETNSNGVAVSSDGNKVLIRANDNVSYIWNVLLGTGTTALTSLPAGFGAVAMSADGTTVAAPTANGVSLWVNGTVTTLSAKLASLGADAGNVVLGTPTGLSSNGKTVIGYGFSSVTGASQAWVIVTP